MSAFTQWLTALGFTLPSDGELLEASIALALALLALAAGWMMGDRFGTRLSALWTRHVGGQTEGLAQRMSPISRHGTAALLLALIAALYDWQRLAALGLGFAEGAAVALLVRAVLRGLALPRWTAWTMGVVAFFAVFSNALNKAGRLAALQAQLHARLDQGVAIGSHQITMLWLINAGVIVVVIFAVVRLVTRASGHLIGGTNSFDPTQKLLAQKLTGIAVIIIAFFVGIDLLGIDLTAFAIFSGAFGLAIGFGLQKTIGNLIAGIILLMDRSIKPGDVIVVGDSFGWVNRIGVRAVSVITRDGKEHLIPNENLMTQEVENWSYTDRNVRVRIPVRVAYDCDLKRAQALMAQAAKDSPRVLDTPQTNVRLTAFGDNGVEHEILVWISDPEDGVGNVRSDVLNRLWLLFKEEGIVIPYPQREVRIVERAAPRAKR
ncbi:mechanosensitive ion channel [Sphingomonas sp. LB-2]|uniref:mechanosensitive ion channel family protein n=1 Tax=Sphingomonas caeni TaxID=2984949 RepID=UPI00223091EF|nr:mechanosensitive ion channel domain-containing protein [Sphingomonas caeni]MCW3847165.1 mechanosensitive ion channel [Sphingomonas caeni]